MKQKISICTSKLQPIYGDKGAIDIAQKLGVDAIDFFTNIYDKAKPDSIFSKSDDEIFNYFTDIRKYAESFGIDIAQTHGRMRIYWNELEKDKYCLENARLDLLAASALRAPVCVMHGINSSVWKEEPTSEYMHDMGYELINRVLVYAKRYNVKLAIETSGFMDITNAPCFFASAKEFKKIFDRIIAEEKNKEYLSICVDTGHVNTVVRFGNPTAGDCIRLYGKHISCLHLHDNSGRHDQHLPMFCGTIDWKDVLDALEEVGYNGAYNLEVNFSRFGMGFEYEAANFSVKLLKHMLEERNS